MGETLTLENVRKAMQKLKGEGERVSRRNVLAVTGGSMSTVHRLMGRIEDIEASEAVMVTTRISDALHKALREEIAQHVQLTTSALEEQIRLLQDREKEALDALAAVELRAEKLSDELETLRHNAGREQQRFEQEHAIAQATIARLENELSRHQADNTQLIEAAEAAKGETARVQLQIERAEKTADKYEARAEKLEVELKKVREDLAQAEQQAAVANQRANDLSDALAKAEQALAACSSTCVVPIH